MSNVVGESRRSQLVGTFGVGAMFPAPDQSLMICGIDSWYEDRCPEVAEPRLAKSLGVQRLRTPSAGRSKGDVPVVRFPRFYFCPECRKLDVWTRFDTEKDSPRCPDDAHVAVPSRFVVACKFGHIDDFPYDDWAHSDPDPSAPRPERTTGVQHRLKLETRGETSSLADIVIRCSCGASRNMEGSFSARALIGVSWCSGKRPWLPGSGTESCREVPRTLQRGSSNTWYGNLRSAISIPPWAEIHNKIRTMWWMVDDMSHEQLRSMFSSPKWVPEGSHWTVDRLIEIVEDIRNGDAPDDARLRQQEFDAIMAGHPETDPADQFVCERVRLPQASPLTPFITEVREVSRLREVTALVSFSRLTPTGPTDTTVAQLSRQQVDWLPAVEVFGEGIFIGLDEAAVTRWAETPFARHRTALIERAAKRSFLQPDVDARTLLVHTFSHALMNELSMDAGYPVASLRERLYTGEGQAGVLIFTATADSAGSLGGLCAQSEPNRLAGVVMSAMRRALWCTADPVCIESQGTGVDNLDLAACHACLLVPETSCEHRNTLLDRALLIGLPDAPDAGFFSGMTRV